MEKRADSPCKQNAECHRNIDLPTLTMSNGSSIVYDSESEVSNEGTSEATYNIGEKTARRLYKGLYQRLDDDKSESDISENIPIQKPIIIRPKSRGKSTNNIQQDLTESFDFSDSGSEYIPSSSDYDSDYCRKFVGVKKRHVGVKLTKNNTNNTIKNINRKDNKYFRVNTQIKSEERKEEENECTKLTIVNTEVENCIHNKGIMALKSMTSNNDIIQNKAELTISKLRNVEMRGLNTENTVFSENYKSNKENFENNYDSTDVKEQIIHRMPKEAKAPEKKHACLFCKKLVVKLPRHFETAHVNETEVADYLFTTNKGSKERKNKIERIRQLGNYAHNARVVETGSGGLIPKKRSRKQRDVDSFAPCKSCMGLYLKKDLYLHFRRCNRGLSGKPSKCAGIFPVSHGATEELKQEILSFMVQDKIFHTIRNDQIILKFGSEIHFRHRNHPHLRAYVSQRMRQLGRLILTARDIDSNINDLNSLISPKQFDLFIAAVQKVSHYDNRTNTYGIPSLALRLRSSIKTCAHILKSHTIINGAINRRNEVTDFIDLVDMNFTTQISNHALNTVYTKKWNKSVILPVAEDIFKLTNYLKEQAIKLTDSLQGDVINVPDWILLSEVTIAQVVLFNRRRPGEVDRILMETYLNRDTAPMGEDVINSLNEIEKHLAKNLTRFETRGKRGRKVPILLTNELKTQIDLIYKYRKFVEIPNENIYLFAKINSTDFISSASKLKKFAESCNLKDPASITSTKLRKQVATTSQLLNLKENEMDQLAAYMGHDIRVHREFYRLPDSSIQVTKVSKLLLSLDAGNILQNKGKDFDSINIIENIASVPDLGVKPNNFTLLQPDFNSEPENSNSSEHDLNSPRRHKTLEPNCHDISQISSSSKKNITKRILTVQKYSLKKKAVKTAKLPWTKAERDAIDRQMAILYMRAKVPNKQECEDCLQNEPDLHRRSWTNVKFFVYNLIKKKNKFKSE